MHDMKEVKEYMSRDMTVLKPDMPIFEAIDLLIKRKVSGAPVINNDNKLVGFLSEKDCLDVLLEAVYQNHRIGFVSEFMITELKTIKSDACISEVASSFAKDSFHKYPVIDENGFLVGTLSRHRLIKAIFNEKITQTTPPF